MLKWEKNLPPAVVGLLRGMLWTIVVAILLAIVQAVNKTVLVPGSVSIGAVATPLILRTLEGLVDQAKGHGGSPAVEGVMAQALEPLVAEGIRSAAQIVMHAHGPVTVHLPSAAAAEPLLDAAPGTGEASTLAAAPPVVTAADLPGAPPAR